MSKIINRSQMRIALEIFRNPGINLTEIIKKTRLSPNYVSKFINHLVERKILLEEKLEKKRTYLRRFFLNFNSESTINFFRLVKEEEREIFFNTCQNLKPIFEQLEKEKGVDSAIVYGSYARLEAGKESDLDILIISNIKNKDRIKEIFVSLDIDTSIKVETPVGLKKRKEDALHQQIRKEGIVIFDKNRKYFEVLIK